MVDPEELMEEGLAAQIYAIDRFGYQVWWHLLDEKIKIEYRKRAKERIDKFHREDPFRAKD